MMIECEYRCIKHEGNSAHYRILLKDQKTELNICSTCLDTYFHPSEYQILENYTLNQIRKRTLLKKRIKKYLDNAKYGIYGIAKRTGQK